MKSKGTSILCEMEGLSLKQHGKMKQPSPMIETCWNNTRIDINYTDQLDDRERRLEKGKIKTQPKLNSSFYQE
jgi:hypothetical protein